MAQLPQEFTIYGLAIEFDLNKETVARRIRNIKPRRMVGTVGYYRISDVAHELVQPTARKSTNRKESEDRRAAAEAELKELELRERKSWLIPIQESEAAVDEAFARVRARLLETPAKLAPVLVPDRPDKARRVLDVAVREVMAELERYGDDEQTIRDESGSQEAAEVADSGGVPPPLPATAKPKPVRVGRHLSKAKP